jgi:hypothetical protein
MVKFKADMSDEKQAALESEIEKRLEKRKAELGDVREAERKAIGSLLDYGRAGIDDVSYDLFNARKYVKMFPEADVAAGEATPCLPVRLYQKVVRRLLRQQVVFNESVLGVLEDHEERLSKLESEAKQPATDSSKR